MTLKNKDQFSINNSKISKAALSKCIDKNAAESVLGNIIKKPALLKEYKITLDDFTETLHKIILKAVMNLSERMNKIDAILIDEHISSFQLQSEYYKRSNGIKYIQDLIECAKEDEFDYYYNLLKKYTLLRRIWESGTSVEEYFDANEVDVRLIDERQQRIYNSSYTDIMDFYRKKQLQAFNEFLFENERDSKKAGVDGMEQKEIFKKGVVWGLGYASDYLTYALYGLRPRRFTVGSAGTGVGKTRMTIANLCFAFAPYYYDSNNKTWCRNPNACRDGALYIGTEMELLEEIEPILWAYMADVPQSHIIENTYEDGEEERVETAIEILDKIGNIWLEYVPNYDVGILENLIEEHKIKHNVRYVFFDYIHSTVELVSEYTSQIGKMSSREDQVLLNLSTKLKDMARKYNVSIDTWTQVSGDFKNEENRDQTIVRGARSIIDKADAAYIASRPTKKEIKQIEDCLRNILGAQGTEKSINLVLSVYKNRGGKCNNIKIWLNVDYETMRVKDKFVTDYNGALS